MLANTPTYSVRKRVLLLNSLPTIARLGSINIVSLAENSRWEEFEEGEYILREGEAVRHLHIIIDGEVEISRHEQSIATLHRGGDVGFLAIVINDPHGVTAKVKRRLRSLCIPADVVRALFEGRFSFARYALEVVTQHFAERSNGLPVYSGNPNDDSNKVLRCDDPLLEKVLWMQNTYMGAASVSACFDIAEVSDERHAEPGEVLLKQGEVVERLVMLAEGKIRCWNDAGEVVVAPKITLGAMSMLNDSRLLYSAEAIGRVRYYEVSVDNLWSVMETHRTIARGMVANAAIALLPKPLETQAAAQ